ncbi:hypothetical protein FGO68_gene5886 [Halteria grandinella]|uniref:Uncharacterized protein n=1 Tax=Halteria grandinella TaxID=5974 RepID=A0A8J8T5Z9_HALGN|nr:hypothetical protein FGO68_gene5886 [Halteria grandinella]
MQQQQIKIAEIISGTQYPQKQPIQSPILKLSKMQRPTTKREAIRNEQVDLSPSMLQKLRDKIIEQEKTIHILRNRKNQRYQVTDLHHLMERTQEPLGACDVAFDEEIEKSEPYKDTAKILHSTSLSKQKVPESTSPEYVIPNLSPFQVKIIQKKEQNTGLMISSFPVGKKKKSQTELKQIGIKLGNLFYEDQALIASNHFPQKPLSTLAYPNSNRQARLSGRKTSKRTELCVHNAQKFENKAAYSNLYGQNPIIVHALSRTRSQDKALNSQKSLRSSVNESKQNQAVNMQNRSSEGVNNQDVFKNGINASYQTEQVTFRPLNGESKQQQTPYQNFQKSRNINDLRQNSLNTKANSNSMGSVKKAGSRRRPLNYSFVQLYNRHRLTKVGPSFSVSEITIPQPPPLFSHASQQRKLFDPSEQQKRPEDDGPQQYILKGNSLIRGKSLSRENKNLCKRSDSEKMQESHPYQNSSKGLQLQKIAQLPQVLYQNGRRVKSTVRSSKNASTEVVGVKIEEFLTIPQVNPIPSKDVSIEQKRPIQVDIKNEVSTFQNFSDNLFQAAVGQCQISITRDEQINESLDLSTKSYRRSVVLQNSIDYADKARQLREEIKSLKSGLSIDTLILSQNNGQSVRASNLKSPKKSFKQKRLKPQYVINQDLDDTMWQYSGCEAARAVDFFRQSPATTTQCNDSN